MVLFSSSCNLKLWSSIWGGTIQPITVPFGTIKINQGYNPHVWNYHLHNWNIEILKFPGHDTIYNILHFYSHPQTDRNAHPRSFHDLLFYLFGDNSMIPSLETFKSPKSPQLLGRKPLNILEPSPTVRVPGSSPRFAVPLQRAAERPRRSAAAQRGGRAAGGASHGAAGAAGRGAGRPHRARPGGLGGLMLSTGSRVSWIKGDVGEFHKIVLNMFNGKISIK